MANNIRGSRVVMPGFTAEYDRISLARPFGIIVGGVALWVIGSLFAIAAGLGDGALVFLLLLSTGVGVAGTAGGAFLAIRGSQRAEAITRDIEVLRDIAMFDENALDDEKLWEAAGIARELDDIEVATDRLASARIRAAAHEQELAERQQRMFSLERRISDLVL